MRTLKIRAVVAVTNDGKDYVIHGSSDETPEEMFKAITRDPSPLWTFNPAEETAHFVEIEITLPEFDRESVNAADVS